MITRTQAFQYFRCCGLSYADIDKTAIQYLICLLDEQFIRQRKERIDANRQDLKWLFTLTGKAIRAHYNLDGSIFYCLLSAKCADGTSCEAVSFFSNEGISFGRDASEEDIQPVLQAFIEWSDWLENRKFNRQSGPQEEEQDFDEDEEIKEE